MIKKKEYQKIFYHSLHGMSSYIIFISFALLDLLPSNFSFFFGTCTYFMQEKGLRQYIVHDIRGSYLVHGQTLSTSVLSDSRGIEFHDIG